MEQDAINQIGQYLKRLPPNQISLVLDFVSFLADRQRPSSSLETMLVAESALKRDWSKPEEDTAWASL